MQRFASVTTLILAVFCSGCGSLPGLPFGWGGDKEECAYVTVIVYLPPVVADLDYAPVNSGRDQAIILGGYEHVLTVKGIAPGADALLPMQRTGIRGRLLGTQTILFKLDSTDIGFGGQEKLDKLLEGMGQSIGLQVEVAGHADATGSDAHNNELSMRRAEAVKNYLVAHGVGSENIAVSWFGEDKPEYDNGTELNRALNRRVTINRYGENR